MATEKKERCFERYNNGHLIEGPHLLFRPVMYTPLTRIADSWYVLFIAVWLFLLFVHYKS